MCWIVIFGLIFLARAFTRWGDVWFYCFVNGCFAIPRSYCVTCSKHRKNWARFRGESVNSPSVCWYTRFTVISGACLAWRGSMRTFCLVCFFFFPAKYGFDVPRSACIKDCSQNIAPVWWPAGLWIWDSFFPFSGLSTRTLCFFCYATPANYSFGNSQEFQLRKDR